MGLLSSTARPLFQKIEFRAYLFYGSFVEIDFKTGLGYLDFSVNCKNKTYRLKSFRNRSQKSFNTNFLSLCLMKLRLKQSGLP